MKKSLKIILIILLIFILFVVMDILSIYLKGRPIFAITSDNEVYRGLLYDTYNCQEYSTPQIKTKWSKLNCSNFKINTNETDDNGWYDGQLNEVEGVSMIIKSGTLTKSGATIIITDLSNTEKLFGEYYKIDKNINGEWRELETIIENYAWNLMGYLVNENNELQMDINWEWLYGNLEDGKYRLVKEVDNIYFSVAFVIK